MPGEGIRMIVIADVLFFRDKSKESLRRLEEGFGRMNKSWGFKVNVDKCKMMYSSKKNPWCIILLDGEEQEKLSEFKYLGCMLELDEKETNDVECNKKNVSCWKIYGSNKMFLNIRK